MTNRQSIAAAGTVRTQTVTQLHEKWRAILERLNTVPGCITPRREARLIEAGELERQIARTPAQDAAEIALKLRMVLTGKTTAALSEAALLAGAIEDLGREGTG
jgi:hypothetical protein